MSQHKHIHTYIQLYKLLFFSIDCFTRKLYGRPIKNKTGLEIALKMGQIFEEAGGFPNKVNSDSGTEFRNKHFGELMEKHRIHHFFSSSYQKAQFVERSINSFKKLLTRICASKKSRNWPEFCQEAIYRLNERTHSAIGMAPNKATIENSGEIFAKLYPKLSKNQQPKTGLTPVFHIGDKVRILLRKSGFAKDDVSRTSDDPYLIARILFHPTIRYKLASIPSQEIIVGSYNQTELIPDNS